MSTAAELHALAARLLAIDPTIRVLNATHDECVIMCAAEKRAELEGALMQYALTSIKFVLPRAPAEPDVDWFGKPLERK